MISNIWYKSTEAVPSDDRLVLCCTSAGDMWISVYRNQKWVTNPGYNIWCWQPINKPLAFMFD